MTFEGDEAFISRLRDFLTQIRFEEGCNQFGRARVSTDLLQKAEGFANDNIDSCVKIKALPSYFSKLRNGDYFYIIDKAFPITNRQIALVWLRAQSMGFDTQKAWDNYLMTHGLLKTRFDYYSYGFDDIKVYVGESDKRQRSCRFCHGVTQENPKVAEVLANGFPIVKFGDKNNAHAISDALGNKNLFCLEECITCNEKLSKVERNFVALMDWRRAMMGIRNKNNKLTNVFGEGASLRVDEQGNQTLYIDETLANPRTEQDVLSIRLNNKKAITDQGVYKALCKYAINLMPSQYLCHLSQTIDWICGRITETELPEVQVAYKMPFVSQPVLDLYFNNTGNPEVPLCTAMLHVCDISYLYILPLADTDGARFKAKGSLSEHWESFYAAFPAYWKTEDMSDYRPSTPWIDIEAPIKESNIKLVLHGDPILKQPVSSPKPGAKVKPRPVEHHFPPFVNECARFVDVKVSKFNILYNDAIASDALHNATVVIDGIRCTVNLIENKASISSSFTVHDPIGVQPYFEFAFTSSFELNGADKYISVSNNYLALDYNLRDLLFYVGCIGAQQPFNQCVCGTQFAICSLLKTLCDDERNLSHIQYQLITNKGNYMFSDTDIHNNPFDI